MSDQSLLDIYSECPHLGDNLSYTPLMAATPCRMHMYDDPANRCMGPIFEGLAEVVFDNGSPTLGRPRGQRGAQIMAPHSLRFLYEFGFTKSSAVPVVRLREEEVEWARGFLGDLSNICAIKCNTRQAKHLTPPVAVLERIVALNPGVRFINFGLSSNHAKYDSLHTSISGIQDVLDLPVRQHAACYSLIKRLISPDTGDYHLMLAVGGRCDVLVPPSSRIYPHAYFHYGPACWRDESIRVNYLQWERLSESTPITGITGLRLS